MKCFILSTEKKPSDFAQATSMLSCACFAGFCWTVPGRWESDHCEAEPPEIGRSKLRNEDTSVLIIGKRENPSRRKMLFPKADPYKEDQTFVILSSVHPSLLKPLVKRRGFPRSRSYLTSCYRSVCRVHEPAGVTSPLREEAAGFLKKTLSLLRRNPASWGCHRLKKDALSF